MHRAIHQIGWPPVRWNWARAVSDILSPPVIWAVVAFPIALHQADSEAEALLWALVYGGIVCWLPMLYVVWNVKRGNITDLHIRVRSQRLRPFLVTILCTAIASATFVVFKAPPLLPLFALFSMLQLLLMTAITVVWQISIHAMSISGAVITAGALYGTAPALLLFPLIVLVGAARVKLRRHTFAQVVAGCVVGAGMTVLLFSLV